MVRTCFVAGVHRVQVEAACLLVSKSPLGVVKQLFLRICLDTKINWASPVFNYLLARFIVELQYAYFIVLLAFLLGI